MIPVPTPFGFTRGGEAVEKFTLRSPATNLEVDLISLGAAILAVRAPDRAGQLVDITLGYDTVPEWEAGDYFFGAIVGRFANRIDQGRFILDGRPIQIPCNDAPHALHGGPEGFHRRVWVSRPIENGVTFSLVSPDGDQGFPGALTTEVTYRLDDAGRLTIAYRAETDAPTILNLTNHCYFNLAGAGPILDHHIRIPAAHFTPVDSTLMPTGEIAPVEGTPLDLRTLTRIGDRIDDAHPAIAAAGGFDHNFVPEGDGLREAAYVLEPRSGRTLSVHTTEPGMQFYSGNFLRDEAGKGGKVHSYRGGFCLETQHFPNSPNQPHFPSTVLRPGEVYESTTIFAFGVSSATDAIPV